MPKTAKEQLGHKPNKIPLKKRRKLKKDPKPIDITVCPPYLKLKKFAFVSLTTPALNKIPSFIEELEDEIRREIKWHISKDRYAKMTHEEVIVELKTRGYDVKKLLVDMVEMEDLYDAIYDEQAEMLEELREKTAEEVFMNNSNDPQELEDIKIDIEMNIKISKIKDGALPYLFKCTCC
jgi:hypothetical protein